MALQISLSGQVALVTGASRGIGREIATRLAAAGSSVILNARTESPQLKDAAAVLTRTYDVRCEAFAADVSDATQVNALFQRTFKEFKRLDTLVNNAGVLRDALIGMIRQEDVTATLGTNTIGTLNCIRVAARLLERSGGGSIVNISSIIGVRGNAGQLVYAASKGAVVAATLAAAKELAPKGIRVNAIAPGYIETEMIQAIPEEIHRARMASIAMGRIGTAGDVADVALFLASPLARYVTGAIIGVDGGMLI